MIKVGIENASKVQEYLKSVAKNLEATSAEALEKDVYALERNIAVSSPVDTGRYKNNWQTFRISKYQWEIRNRVEYAKYLIFGAAGRPILHDIRGIVRYWKNHIRSNILNSLKK